VNKEEKNKKIGLVVSGAFHLLLLLAFLFIIAWKEPDPPIPEYGIELNFGLEDAGSGDVQPQATNEPVQSETEEVEEQQESEPTQEEIVEETETVEEESTPEEVTTNTQDSPDVIEPAEQSEESAPQEQNEVVERQTEPTATNTATEETNTQPQGNNQADEVVQNTSQGDSENEQGDQGDEQGTLDSRALYGESGGGGGSSLEMTGWVWDFKPQPDDTSNENGRIVFEIKIDDQGEIISVRTLERSVSPAIEKVYREEVEKLTFSRTSDNSIAAPISTGKITFVIKSK